MNALIQVLVAICFGSVTIVCPLLYFLFQLETPMPVLFALATFAIIGVISYIYNDLARRIDNALGLTISMTLKR